MCPRDVGRVLSLCRDKSVEPRHAHLVKRSEDVGDDSIKRLGGLLVLLFLPVWMTWRFMEQLFFFFPTISQQLIGFRKHPIRLSRFSL